MLTLNTQLQEKRSKFLRRLTDNFSGVKIKGTLEKFDTLDFAQFVRELNKQKNHKTKGLSRLLTLKDQDEWEEYFNAYRNVCQSLVTQIATTDQTIDKNVYELYGLTDEEIAIVEQGR